MDTQWPRYEVFVQEKEGKPYLDYGSVHAPDAELALMNARDVFARRPEACSMWVVPAGKIFSRTAQELDLLGLPALPEVPEEPGTFEVFCKEKPAGTQAWLAQVNATSPQEALRLALQQHPTIRPFTWWVVPSRAVVASDPAEIDSLFSPAREKRFRMSTDFKTHSAMQKLREEGR